MTSNAYATINSSDEDMPGRVMAVVYALRGLADAYGKKFDDVGEIAVLQSMRNMYKRDHRAYVAFIVQEFKRRTPSGQFDLVLNTGQVGGVPDDPAEMRQTADYLDHLTLLFAQVKGVSLDSGDSSSDLRIGSRSKTLAT
jgi:hypothetical protein